MSDRDLAVMALVYGTLGNGVAWFVWWRLRRLARIVEAGLEKQAQLTRVVQQDLEQRARRRTAYSRFG